METSYAVLLIKPDAVRDILEEVLIQDICLSANVEVIFRKYWKINNETARLIYPEWVERQEFTSMAYNITQGYSLFTLVSGSWNIYESLKRVKGKMNCGGIRLKYRTHSIDEWISLGYLGRDLQNKVAENRIHTTDNLSDTLFLCALALDPDDVSLLEKIAPQFILNLHSKMSLQKTVL